MRIWIFLMLLLLASPLVANDKVALVIGNSNYTEIGSLSNPLNDANAVADRLKKLGFTILRPVDQGSDVQKDLTLDQFFKAQSALEKAASGKKIALIYYDLYRIGIIDLQGICNSGH